MEASKAPAVPLGYSGMMVGWEGIEPSDLQIKSLLLYRLATNPMNSSGAPGNRTRLTRIKSPQHRLDANTPLSVLARLQRACACVSLEPSFVFDSVGCRGVEPLA